jgi:hypothetical protein
MNQNTEYNIDEMREENYTRFTCDVKPEMQLFDICEHLDL